MLDLREPQLERVPLLARHEAELAGKPIARLLREIAEPLDARPQLGAQLLHELTKDEAAVAIGGHAGATSAAAAAAPAWRRSRRAASARWERRRRRHPRPTRGPPPRDRPAPQPGRARASAWPPRPPRPPAAGARPR